MFSIVKSGRSRVKVFAAILFVSAVIPAQAHNNKRPNNNPDTALQAAQARMHNRDVLLKKGRSRAALVPLTPEQKHSLSEQRRLERAANRNMLAMYQRRKPGHTSKDPREELRFGEHISQRLHASLTNVLSRLHEQIGKPYVWGGQSPAQGFDCSGLVFFAFSPVLNRTLPRTADGLYQDRTLHQVEPHKLRTGDLVFFNINQRPGADHVGVYLGDDKFIEAPRHGLNIRISQLSNAFWQARFLGARRILTEEAIL